MTTPQERFVDEVNIVEVKMFDDKIYTRNDKGEWKRWTGKTGEVVSTKEKIYIKDGVVYEIDNNKLLFNGKTIRNENGDRIRAVHVSEGKIYIGDNNGWVYIYENEKLISKFNCNNRSNNIDGFVQIGNTIYVYQYDKIGQITHDNGKYKYEFIKQVCATIRLYDGNYIIDSNYIYKMDKDWRYTKNISYGGSCFVLGNEIILNQGDYIAIYDTDLNKKYEKNMKLNKPFVCGSILYQVEGNGIVPVDIELVKNYICPKCQKVALVKMEKCECGAILEDLEAWILKKENINQVKPNMLPINLLNIERGEIKLRRGQRLSEYIVNKQNALIEKQRESFKTALLKTVEDQYPMKTVPEDI